MQVRWLILSALLLSFTGVVLADEKDDKAERAKFKGKWMVTAMTFNGSEVPAEQLKSVPWYWEIDEKIHSKRPGRNGTVVSDDELEYTLDPSQKPKGITLTDIKRKETNKGIYKFDGDTLTICFTTKGERPDDFTSAKDSNRVLLVFKPVKE